MEYPAEVRLEVYDAIIEYAASGKLSELKPLSKMAFSFIKKEMDYNQLKYDERIKKSQDNGRNGGNPNFKKGKANPYYQRGDVEITQDNLPLSGITQDNQTLPDITLNDNDNVNDNVNDNEGIYPPSPGFAILTLAECRQELEQDEAWLEMFAMNNHLPTTDAVRDWIGKFFAQLQNEGVTDKSPRDAKSHFARWYSIRAEKQRQESGESLSARILQNIKDNQNKRKQ